MPRRLEQVHDALLARDAPDEHDVRARSDRCRGARARRCLGSGRYSAVSMPLWMTCTRSGIDRGIGRSGCPRFMPALTAITRVGRLDRDLLAEARDARSRRRAARPSRAVSGSRLCDGHHVRDAVDQLRQVPAEVRVPGVAVDEVRALHARGHQQVDATACAAPQGRGSLALRAPPRARSCRSTSGRSAARRSSARASFERAWRARAPGTRRGRRRRRRFPAGIRGSRGRRLFGHERIRSQTSGITLDPCRRPRRTFSVADGEAARRSSLEVDADPRAGRHAHVLVDDRAPHDGWRPTSTPCMQHRVLDRAPGVHAHAGRDDRAPHGAARDDDARADHRVERGAAPAVVVEHELGRRQRARRRVDRPLVGCTG